MKWFGIVWGLALLLCGCVLRQRETPTPIPSPQPGWESIAPGVERRTYTPENNLFGQLIVLRIDPALYTFRAHYKPGEARTLSEWQAQIPDAIAFVNTNFFDANHHVLGLLVVDGVVYGASYQDRGGTFLVQNDVPRVRSNRAEPYTGEPLEQAVQAFPMLVQNGTTTFEGNFADRPSRRTVVAQDSRGRILLMVTPLLGISLSDLSAYLPTTDMDIVNALNLDGGGSSMLYYRASESQPAFTLPSFDPVPSVLAVYPR